MSSSKEHSASEVKNPHKSHAEAKNSDISRIHTLNGGVAQLKHVDGTIAFVDTKVIGGDYKAIPPGYFRSLQFLGTLMVRKIGVYGTSLFCMFANAACFRHNAWRVCVPMWDGYHLRILCKLVPQRYPHLATLILRQFSYQFRPGSVNQH